MPSPTAVHDSVMLVKLTSPHTSRSLPCEVAYQLPVALFEFVNAQQFLLELLLVVANRHDLLVLPEEVLEVELVVLGQLSAHESLHDENVLAFVLVRKLLDFVAEGIRQALCLRQFARDILQGKLMVHFKGLTITCAFESLQFQLGVEVVELGLTRPQLLLETDTMFLLSGKLSFETFDLLEKFFESVVKGGS